MNISTSVISLINSDRGLAVGMPGRVIAIDPDGRAVVLFQNGVVITGAVAGDSVHVSPVQARSIPVGREVITTRDITSRVRRGQRGTVIFLGGRYFNCHTVRFRNGVTVANLPLSDLIAVDARFAVAAPRGS